MFVYRYKAAIKRGNLKEALTMLKSFSEQHPYLVTICVPVTGVNSTLSFDIKFENMEQFGQFLKLLNESNESEDMQRWYQITDVVESELLSIEAQV